MNNEDRGSLSKHTSPLFLGADLGIWFFHCQSIAKIEPKKGNEMNKNEIQANKKYLQIIRENSFLNFLE